VDETADTDVAPSESLLVAVSLTAYMAASCLPYKEPLRELHVPADLDKETLLDTVAACCLNAFGTPFSPTLADTLATILRRLLGSPESQEAKRGMLSDDEVQHVLQTAFLASGGPTPGLVRLIVAEVETARKEDRQPKVPKEAELPLKASPEEVKQIYDEMAKRRKQGLPLELFGKALVENSTCDDLVEGLRGQWGSMKNAIMPFVWPPDMSTALRLTRSARRDEWVGNTVVAARQVKDRFDKRAQRERKRFPVELDKPVETGEGRVSLHGLIPDGSATIEAEESFEEALGAYSFTQREQQVAKLIADYKQVEIAHILGLSPGRVSQLVAQIEAKMEAKAKAEGKLHR